MTRSAGRLLAAVICIALVSVAPSGPASAKTHHASRHAAKGGYTVLSGGLKYKDLVVGKGPKAKAWQIATVSYVGMLTNGTVFDASARHGDGTFRFAINRGQVIKGWDEGVVGMQVGGTRKLIVPPALGYGALGAGSAIPPNSTLVFTIQLRNLQTLK